MLMPFGDGTHKKTRIYSKTHEVKVPIAQYPKPGRRVGTHS